MSIRLGVVGYGDAAASFVEAARYQEGWDPVAVGGRNMEKARAFAETYGIEARTVESMAASGDLEVIAVTTPPGVHLQDTLTCLAGGKHLIVEKPFALTVADCDRMIEAAEEAGRLLMVGQTHRFFASEMRVREIIDSGEPGRVLMLEDVQIFNYFGPKRVGWQLDPALSGGGVVMNPVIHFTDRLRYFAGSEVESVRAALGAEKPGYEIEGRAQVFYTFEGGKTSASLTCCGYGHAELDRTRIFCEKGMIQLDFYANLVTVYRDGRILRTESPQPEPYDSGPNRLIYGYVQQLVEFGLSLSQGAPLRSDGANGRANVAVCQAIFEAAATGKQVNPRV